MTHTFNASPDVRQAATPLEIGTRFEPFFDDWLIDRLESDARLRLHPPRLGEVALRLDQPWEGPLSGGGTVLHGDDGYRLYYRGMPAGAKDGSREEVTCVALSDDGVHWHRPELGLVEVAGTRANNVILREPVGASHNFMPFRDDRPDVPDEQRYKAMGGTRHSGIHAFVSADGLHWSVLSDGPVITVESMGLSGTVFDSTNVPFWSDAEQCYLFYFRTWRTIDGQRYRWISRASSPDFVRWSPPTEMRIDGIEAVHLYTQATRPYFRAPHLYVAMPRRFFPQRRVLSDEQVRELDVEPTQVKGISDAILLPSRGGPRYDWTFREAMVRPGPEPGNWSARSNTPGVGLVPTGATEMSSYLRRHYGLPSSYIQRMVWRTDGLGSIFAGERPGAVVTRPLRFAGSELVINYATSGGGEVRFELQTAAGEPIAGHRLDECESIYGDAIEQPVRWSGGSDVSALAGQAVRLRCRLRDADLFAIRFR